MVIRALTPADAEEMYGLRLRGLREHPAAFGQSAEEMEAEPLSLYAERLAADDGRFVVGAFDDTDGTPRLIGLTGCARERRLKTRHRAVLWGMYVAGEHHGRGVGRQLVEETLRRARTLEGLRVVMLRVGVANKAATRLYEAAGFQRWGVEKMALRVGAEFIDEYVMGIVF